MARLTGDFLYQPAQRPNWQPGLGIVVAILFVLMGIAAGSYGISAARANLGLTGIAGTLTVTECHYSGTKASNLSCRGTFTPAGAGRSTERVILAAPPSDQLATRYAVRFDGVQTAYRTDQNGLDNSLNLLLFALILGTLGLGCGVVTVIRHRHGS